MHVWRVQGSCTACVAHGAVLMHDMSALACRPKPHAVSGATDTTRAAAAAAAQALAHASITSTRLEPGFLLQL